MTVLIDEVRRLTQRAARVVEPPAADAFEESLRRLDEPLRVAIAGRVKAGKSTLLNACLGLAAAATDAAECTRVVTWYRHGTGYRATLVSHDGGEQRAVYRRDADNASVDLGDAAIDDVARIVVELASERLVDMTLIDTPGVASISEQTSARTEQFLTPSSGDDGADVIVYLLRNLHRHDTDFLEAFTDRSRSDPVRSIAVLARADEIGCGRGDGLDLARAVADRYAQDAELRRHVSGVVPVSGLLGFAAATLEEREFRAVEALCSLDAEGLERLLLSADRFAAESDGCPVPVEDRTRLLARLGLFGVRHSVQVVRSGRAPSSSALAAALHEASGIGPLNQILQDRFAARADLFKAARGLELLQRAAADGTLPTELAGDVERVSATSHELEEIRCLGAVQSGEAPLRVEERDEVLSALGRDGDTDHARLRMQPGSEVDQLVERAVARMSHLRAIAAQPLVQPEVQRVLAAAVRSLEGVHHRLTASR